ncbi:MAG: YCF48-related protein [Bacteroidota bacterium]
MKYLSLIILILSIIVIPLKSQDFWQEAGTFSGGMINDAAVAQNGDIWIAGNGSGVFRSTDGGQSWQRMNNGLLDWNVSAIYISQSGKMFAGTFDNGVFVSTDAGQSWTYPSFNFDDIEIYFAITDFNEIGGRLYLTTEGAVYASEDDGENWTDLGESLPSYFPHCNTIEGDDEGNLYLATEGALYKSNDLGVNWKEIGKAIIGRRVRDLLWRDGRLYIAAPEGGLIYTDDAGASFVTYNPDIVQFYPFSLGADTEGNIYMAGNPGIFYSTDRGESWTHAETPEQSYLNLTIINDIETDSTGRMLYSGHPEGLWGSADTCSEWHYLSENLPSVTVLSLLDAGDGIIYAGFDALGVYASSDRGESWEWHNNSLWLASSVNDMTLTPQGDIYICADDDIYKEAPDSVLDYRWREINIDTRPKNCVTADARGNLYVGSNLGVMRRLSGSDSWEHIRDGILYHPLEVYDIIADNNDDLYIGVQHYGAYFSTNGGDFWQRLLVGLGGGATSIIDLEADPENNIYAATDGAGLYKLDRDSLRWQRIDKGFANTYVTSVEATHWGLVYAATLNGVYRSYDYGESWEPLNDGLGLRRVLDLMLDGDGYLWAATPGKVYRSRGIIQSVGGNSRDDIYIYPNPAREFVKINLPEIIISAKIKLINSLGEVIIEQSYVSGSEAHLQISGIPAGMYFILVNTAKNNYIEPLIISK